MRRLPPALALVIVAAVLSAPAGPASSAERTRERVLPTPALIERDVARGALDRATADLYLASALTESGDLPAEYRSDVPWRGTVPLMQLRERLAAMPHGTERRSIRETLADTFATCDTDSGGVNNTSSTYFYIEYGTIGGGLNISQYATSLDTSWNTEINTLGWSAPPVAPVPAPGSKYHVVVANLGSGLYGYVSDVGTHAGFVGNNINTPWNDVDAQASCMVLNNDYSGFPGTPQQALDATTAHEFAHSVQFGYGALTGANEPDVSFTEGLATWIEDEVFDGSNDNYNYLWPNFTNDMGSYDEFPYPYWVVFRAITERYGAGTANGGEQIMEDFWELTSQSTTSNMFPALNAGLVAKGTNLADAYHAAAIALKFNRACTGGYVYPYCLEEGPAYVAHPGNGPTPVSGTISSAPGNFPGSVPDNYALNWVALPTSGGPYDVTLQNTSGGGQLRATVACDTGTALNLSPLPAVVGAGATTTLPSFSPSGCSSVVAVITNQSQTENNPPASIARTYTLATGPPGSDTTPPETIITSGPSGTVSSSSASFSFTSTESGSSFACSLDGGAYAGCTSPSSYTGLSIGPHVFRVRATDPSGNTDGSPAERTWTVAVQVHARQVSLTLKKHLRAQGIVTTADGFAACTGGAVVQVQRRSKGGGWPTVRSVSAGSSGTYKTRLPDRAAKYRAVVAETAAGAVDICGAAQSPVRKHRHG